MQDQYLVQSSMAFVYLQTFKASLMIYFPNVVDKLLFFLCKLMLAVHFINVQCKVELQ
jgi:hypothetical protein